MDFKLFNKPFWYSTPKLIGYSLDGKDTSQQFADIYSLSHITHGILFFLLFNYFTITKTNSLYYTILFEIIWELFENTDFIINKYRKNYRLYNGDSIINMIGDVIFAIIGYYFTKNYYKLSILFVIITEILLYPYNASLLQTGLLKLFL